MLMVRVLVLAWLWAKQRNHHERGDVQQPEREDHQHWVLLDERAHRPKRNHDRSRPCRVESSHRTPKVALAATA
jgi:hypothetical protein